MYNRQYQLWPTNPYQTSNVTQIITTPVTPVQPAYQESNQLAGWDTVPYAGGGHTSQVQRQQEHHGSTYAQGNTSQHSGEYSQQHQSQQPQDSYSRGQYQEQSYYGGENYQQEGWVNYDKSTSQQYADYSQYSQSDPSYETVNQRGQSGYETVDQRGQSGYETVSQRGQSGYETTNQRGQSGYGTMNQRSQGGHQSSYEQSQGNYSQSNTYNANGLNASYESPLKVLDNRRSNEATTYSVPTSFYSKKLGGGNLTWEKKRDQKRDQKREEEDFRRPPPIQHDPTTPADIVAKFKTNHCIMCDVKLNSRAQSEHHYIGKPHAKKLKMVLDKRFGIGTTTGSEEQVKTVNTNLSPVPTTYAAASSFKPRVPEKPKVVQQAPETPPKAAALGMPMGFVGKSGALKGFVASSTGNLSTGLPPIADESTNTGGVVVLRNVGVKTGLGFVGVNAAKNKNKKKKKRSGDAPSGDNFDPSAPKKKKKGVNDLNQLYCNCCDLSFTSQEHATEHFLGRNHERVMHGLKPLSPDDPITPTELLKKGPDGKMDLDFSKGKGKFFCDVCSIALTSSTQLEMHMKGSRHMQMKMKARASQASGGASSGVGGALAQSSAGGADDGSSLPMSFFSNKLGPSEDGGNEEGDPSFTQDEAEANAEFGDAGLPMSFFSKKLSFGNNSNKNNNNTNNNNNSERRSRSGGRGGRGGGGSGGRGGGGGGGNRKKQNFGGVATGNLPRGNSRSQTRWDSGENFPVQRQKNNPQNYQTPNMGGKNRGKKQNANPMNYQNQNSGGKNQGQKSKKKKPQGSNQNQKPKDPNPSLFSNVKKVKENDDESALPMSFFSNRIGGFKENSAAIAQGEYDVRDSSDLPMSFFSNRLDVSNINSSNNRNKNNNNKNNNSNKKKKPKVELGGFGLRGANYGVMNNIGNVPNQNKKRKKRSRGGKKTNKESPKISDEGSYVTEGVTRCDDDGFSIPMTFFSNKYGGFKMNISEEESGSFGDPNPMRLLP